jgi:hypothetical protein
MMKENMSLQNYTTISDELVKISPPAAVGGFALFGIPLPELIQIGTLIYLVFIIVDKGYALFRKFKDRGRKE